VASFRDSLAGLDPRNEHGGTFAARVELAAFGFQA
jgi:hypothetical protein